MAKASYTKVFADPYPNGWKAKPDLSTPYLTTIRDNHDATLRAIENHLYNNPLVSNLQDLDDVAISSITNGQILVYNSTTGKFQNADAPSGGGGTSYSFDEAEIGTDEYGLTLYSKTFVELPLVSIGEEHVYQANGSGAQFDVSTRLNNKSHRIYPKDLIGTIYFDCGEEWPINFVDVTNMVSGECYSWTKALFFHNTYSNYSTSELRVNTKYRYYDQSSSTFKYYYVDKVRFTIIYTKDTNS